MWYELGRLDDHNLRKLIEVVTVECKEMRDSIGQHYCHKSSIMNPSPNDAMLGDKVEPAYSNLRGVIGKRELGQHPVDLQTDFLYRPAKAICRTGATSNRPKLNQVLWCYEYLISSTEDYSEGINRQRVMGRLALYHSQPHICIQEVGRHQSYICSRLSTSLARTGAGERSSAAQRRTASARSAGDDTAHIGGRSSGWRMSVVP